MLDCELLALLLELFALDSLVLEIDEDELDETDDELLDELLELDDALELDRLEPPELLSELLLLDSSGMSVHVAQICTVNARRRRRSPVVVSPAIEGPVSLAPWHVNPTVRLRYCRKLRSRTISRAAPKFVDTMLPVGSIRLSVYDEISIKAISKPARPAYSSGCSELKH